MSAETMILRSKQEHEWHMRERYPWECCRLCGVVRRRDDNNKPCRGPVKVALRSNQETPDVR